MRHYQKVVQTLKRLCACAPLLAGMNDAMWSCAFSELHCVLLLSATPAGPGALHLAPAWQSNSCVRSGLGQEMIPRLVRIMGVLSVTMPQEFFCDMLEALERSKIVAFLEGHAH